MSGVLQQAKLAVTGEVARNTTGPPEWQDGICSCMDDTGICCQTLCCLPCTLSNVINQRDTGIAAFDCCTCIFTLVAGYISRNEFYGWLSMSFRRELVQRYGIQGESTCNSCLLGLCCAPCTICQVQREMGKRKEHCAGCCANPPADEPGMVDKIAGAVGAAVNSGGHLPRTWGSGLCGCDGSECIEGICCGPCVYGFIGNRIDAERVPGKTPEPALDPVSCFGSLFFYQGWTYANRREVIERYNVTGETHVISFCMAYCCTPCAQCQQRREMGYANEFPGGICVKEPPAKQQ